MGIEYDFNILYYIELYRKWWKKITKSMASIMFFALMFSLLLPAKYISTITIILPKGDTQIKSSIGSFLGISSLSMGASSEDMIVAIIKSKRMAKDIYENFKLYERKKFKYSLETYVMPGGFSLEAKGNDPALTEKIANFCVQNLDKINAELNLTPERPMVKVLDPAAYGVRMSRGILKNVFVAGLFTFLAISLYIFFKDYMIRLKGDK